MLRWVDVILKASPIYKLGEGCVRGLVGIDDKVAFVWML